MRISPKAFDILHYFVDRADRLVTQDELLEALWPETYVNPEGIRKYILEIRKVLGDRPSHPLFIETLPKRGYQFVAKVTEECALPTSEAQTSDRVVFVAPEAGVGETMLVVYTIRVEIPSWLRRKPPPELAPHFEECRDSNTPIGNRVLHS